MPKALFFNVPAHGHVNPSLPLVAELAHRGHEITYYISESYREKVEAAGAVYKPYADVHDDYFESHGLDGSRPQKAAYALMTTAGEILPELLEAARATQPDYIMFDGMCPWGYLVARSLRLPAVTSLSLMALAAAPQFLLNLETLRILVPMLMRDFGKGVESNKLSQALGKKYNVVPLGAMSRLQALGDISISYTSAYFQPYVNAIPNTVKFVGRAVDESASSASFSFESVKGRRLVYISLGTVNNKDTALFRTCIEAFAGSDDFVIMSTGNGFSPAALGVVPENITVHSWVPQIAVLKQASLFITHAGLNSVHDGLYFGLPLLLVPQQEEQTLTSLRVVELGAGLMLKKAQVNAKSIRANATQLLADPRFKLEAKRIGDTLRASGGMTRAADEIESLLLRKHTDSSGQ